MNNYTEAKNFYDKFTKKLVTDYISGNIRMEEALDFVVSHIPNNVTRILDVGCGIGWSTFEMSKAFPDCTIFGVDLSPNSISCAQQLFKKENTNFRQADVTKDEIYSSNTVDAIVMIDVLEHISESDRYDFIEHINRLLNENGLFIVTCPTVYHQNYLREKGEGLQPVDEDITLDIMNEIAKQMNGEITFFSYKSIWHSNDYFHAVIQKGIKGCSTPCVYVNYNSELKGDRLKRIKNSDYSRLFTDEELKSFEENTPKLGCKDKIKKCVKRLI